MIPVRDWEHSTCLRKRLHEPAKANGLMFNWIRSDIRSHEGFRHIHPYTRVVQHRRIKKISFLVCAATIVFDRSNGNVKRSSEPSSRWPLFRPISSVTVPPSVYIRGPNPRGATVRLTVGRHGGQTFLVEDKLDFRQTTWNLRRPSESYAAPSLRNCIAVTHSRPIAAPL